MDRRKFTATLAALAAGIGLSVGSASAQKPPYQGTAGYLQGDPAPGKLIPYFLADGNAATIIGIENTIGNDGPDGAELDFPIGPTTVHIAGGDVLVHITVFDTRSNELLNFDKCYSPFAFGYIVLQEAAISASQQADLNFKVGNGDLTREAKSEVVTVPVSEGYVTVRAFRVYATSNGTCGSEAQGAISADIPDAYDLLNFGGPLSTPLATWAIVQDVGTGFFATEVPTVTARVDPIGGAVSGGIGAFGLIPRGNEVIARYDAASFNESVTHVFVWMVDNGNSTSGFLDCEDEQEVSTPIPLPNEIQRLVLSGSSDTPTSGALAPALGVCAQDGQFRGVLRFTMPDTGFIWSHITQESAHFRMNFLGYNLQNNWFVDCADGFLDFDRPDGGGDCS